MVMSMANRARRAATSNASPGPAAMASGELAKATLSKLDSPTEEIELMFNPTSFSISKSVDWSKAETKASDVDRLDFTSGGSRTLSLSELLFDTYEEGVDVRRYTDKLFELTKISTKHKRPPKCMFVWGNITTFPAIVESMDIDYTLFLSNGTPVRAKMNITLKECEDENSKPGQNPTTQGFLGQKVHVVKPGETIDWIAYQEYNDSNMWRFIANTNNLDNPRDLRPGQVLAIQPLEELEA